MLVLGLFAGALAWAVGLAWTVRHPAPLSAAQAGSTLPTPQDRDADTLPDRVEDELLARYAPTAIVAPDDPSLPASIEWIRERAGMTAAGPRVMGISVPERAFSSEIRRGSRDRRDWTVYGHAYPRADGGVELQYWLYYPYNEGPLFFDHESDWEHVSIELAADGEPRTFALAAHNDNAPGRRYPWSVVRREGSHPFFFVAAGTHASYLRAEDAPFWERLPACSSEGASCQALYWRPGREASEQGSPLVNVGERGHARVGDADDAFFMTYAGLWGSAVPVIGSAAPYGPPFQRGFCVDAARGTCR